MNLSHAGYRLLESIKLCSYNEKNTKGHVHLRSGAILNQRKPRKPGTIRVVARSSFPTNLRSAAIEDKQAGGSNEMASFSGGPFRPAMGRYSLLPSASNWAGVSEDAENVTPVVEGTLYFVLFHCIVMPFSRDRFPV